LGIALFDATQTVFGMRAEGMHHDWKLLFVAVMLSWLPWAAATPFVIQLGRKFPPTHLRAWAAHLTACFGLAVISSAWSALLYTSLNPYLLTRQQPFLSAFGHKLFYEFLPVLILYAFILLVSFVLDARSRLSRQETATAQLNEQLTRAQLSALRRQIEPHFLFNALHAVAGLVREGRNEAAVSMIVALSDFLRRTLEDPKRHEVPLQEELEFVQRYLEIQKVRFAERLQLTVEVPTELLPIPVPALILQPIVENAVKHGIAKRTAGGAVRISANRLNSTLTLRVYNDGPALAGVDGNAELGVGLANVRTRLHGLYGDASDLTIHNQSPDGVETCVSMPFREP
jgi:sensor histidine kinase YesM